MYWLDENGGVRRSSKTGAPAEPAPPAWGAAISSGCFDFAVDDSFVYCAIEQRIIRTRKNTGAATAEVLATGLEARAEFVAVDATHIYFTVAGRVVVQSTEADSIYRMPKPAP